MVRTNRNERTTSKRTPQFSVEFPKSDLTIYLLSGISEIFRQMVSTPEFGQRWLETLINGLPRWIFELFSLRNEVSSYSLKESKGKLTIPLPCTNYVKNSFSYKGSVLCNSSPVLAWGRLCSGGKCKKRGPRPTRWDAARGNV